MRKYYRFPKVITILLCTCLSASYAAVTEETETISAETELYDESLLSETDDAGTAEETIQAAAPEYSSSEEFTEDASEGVLSEVSSTYFLYTVAATAV